MRTGCGQQTLSYPLRLPDEIQSDALRVLEVSREVIRKTGSADPPRSGGWVSRLDPIA
jgi:putative transposase